MAILAELRLGMRALRRTPGFSAAAIITLALGIGANSSLFSLLEGVLLRPLPYPQPGRLVRVFETHPQFSRFPLSPANFLDYRKLNQTFEGLAIYTRDDLQLAHDERPERLATLRVSAEYFSVLGTQPALGRAFEERDMTDNSRVAIISDRLWRRRFARDPAIVGGKIRLNGADWQVAAVMPPGFQHVGGSAFRSTAQGETVDLWVPVRLGPGPVPRGAHFMNAVGRLKEGITLEKASADLNRIAVDLEKSYPRSNSEWRIRLSPLREEIVGSGRKLLLILMGAAGFVLLIACANVANLLLARSAARTREIAVRAALGAGRLDLARYVLAESVILGIAGGVLGAALAAGGIELLTRNMPEDFPRLHEIGLNGAVLAFAAVASMAAVLLSGLAPAFRGTQTDVAASLQGGGRTSSRGRETLRIKNALVVSQVALASALLIGAGLLLRSFQMLQRADHGFRPQHVLTFSISVRGAAHSDDSRTTAFFETLLDRIKTLPGVRSAGASTALPWTGWDENAGFLIVGDPAPGERSPHARYNSVTPEYFQTIGAPLKRGRWLTEADNSTAAPVVLVNESLARQYFNGRDPLGRKLDLWGKHREIVGVVAGIKDTPATPTAEPAFYFPLSQVLFRMMSVALRTDGDPMALVQPIRRQVQALDPELPIAEVRTLDDVVDAANAQRRWMLVLVGMFAAMAIGLAAVGAYGVIAYSVEQRRREIGIRAAVGAEGRDIVLLVLGQGMRLAAAGLAIGAVIALGLGRILATLLYGVSPSDPATFALVLPLSATVAALACLLPAWRASRIDPAAAIRSE